MVGGGLQTLESIHPSTMKLHFGGQLLDQFAFVRLYATFAADLELFSSTEFRLLLQNV